MFLQLAGQQLCGYPSLFGDCFHSSSSTRMLASVQSAQNRTLVGYRKEERSASDADAWMIQRERTRPLAFDKSTVD